MKRFLGLFIGAAAVAAQTGLGAVQVAGSLLVDVAASDAAGAGNGNAVASLPNHGSLGGTFDAWGGLPGATYFSSIRGAPALWFDASSNSVLVASFSGTPSQLSGGNNTWSAEFWVLNPNISFNQGDFMSWTRRPGTGGGNTLMEFRYGTDGQIGEHHSGNMPWGTKPPQSLWHHVVLTRDSLQVERVYVNGALTATATLASLNIRADGRMVFGATMNLENDGFQFPYYGYIGQARIHTGVLTDVQVAENYTAELPFYTFTPHPDGTALVDITAGDLALLNDGDFVLSWPDNGALAQPFVSTEPAFGPTYHANVQGAPAVLFDTSTANVLVGALAPAELTANPTYTVEAWLNCPELLAREAAFLSWTPRSAVTGSLVEYRYCALTGVFGEHYTIYSHWGGFVPPAANQWHHIAVTREGATGVTSLYVDGLPNNTETVNGIWARSDGKIILGGSALNDPRAGFQANWGYNGYMAALRISAGVKGADAVLATFNAEAPGYGLATALEGDAVWVNPNGGDWNTAANWDPQTPVNGAGKTASFINGGSAVINDINGLTLSGLLFGEPATDISGLPVTFADGGIIRGLAQTNTISAPLVLGGALTVAPAPGGKGLNLSGDVSGAGPLVSVGGHTILSGNNTFTGGITNQLGVLEVSAITALGAGPLTLGDGTFRYAGPGATYALPVRTETLLAGRPAAIEVSDPAATLTLSGRFEGNAAFIKRGPGALTFTYAGEQQLNGTALSASPTYTYSPDGTVRPATFGALAVEEGLVTLGVPGQTNIMRNAQNVFIGTRNTTNTVSATLDIIAGTLLLPDGNWFCINRGSTGDTAVRVSGADTRVQINAGIVLSNTDGVPNHTGTALLDIDQSTFIAAGNALIGESTAATVAVNIDNGATFEANARNANGLAIAQAENALTTFTVDNASTVRAYHHTVNRNGTLEVKGGSRFETDLPSQTSFVHNHATINKGTVLFDDATLAQRTANNTIGLWLQDTPALLVGDGGLTLDALGWTYLDAPITAAPGAAAPAVTKTGPGTAVIRPTALNATSAGGTLAFHGNAVMNISNPPPATAVTMAGGNIGGTTDGAFLNTTIVPSGTGTLELFPAPTLRFRDMWQQTSSTAAAPFIRNDGWLQYANGNGSRATGYFLKEKQRVTGPWTVNFSFIGDGINADGFAFVIHNDSRGPTALGDNGSGYGYRKIENSIALSFNTYAGSGKIMYGTNGVENVQDILVFSSIFSLKDNMVKTFITVSYDGTDTLSCTLRRADGTMRTCEVTGVDILGFTGEDTAYVGFTGATGGVTTQHGYLADIIWDDGAASSLRQNVCQYGGTVALGSGTLNTHISNFTSLQGVSALDTLTFADGATLNTEAAISTYGIKIDRSNLLLDDRAWQLNQYAVWLDDGVIRVTPKVNSNNGTFFSTNRYDVTSAWTASFDYRQGEDSGTPADFISFTIQNISPDQGITAEPWLVPQGISVRWNYYPIRPSTRLELYINGNGTAVEITDSLDPVTLTNKEDTRMTLTYDPDAQTLTVTTEQPSNATTHTHVFPNIDMTAIMSASVPDDGKGYIGCTARVGGSQVENIVTAFRFSGADTPDDSPTVYLDTTPALAFRRYDGTGVINHHGNAPLALLGEIDYAPADVTLRLGGAGLNLRRATDEPLGTAATRGDWIGLNAHNVWEPLSGDAQITYNAINCIGGIASTRRVNIARDFAVRFTYVTANAAADGIALVFHNDPRGPAAHGTTGGACAYQGDHNFPAITKSLALGFDIYLTASVTSNRIQIGESGTWVDGSLRDLPFLLRNTATDVALDYDATAKTLAVTLTNPGGTFTETYTGIDIAAQTEDAYATVAIVGATGGQTAYQAVRNFIMHYPAPIPSADERLAVGATEIPADTEQVITLDAPTVTSPAFLINEGAFGDGATLRLASWTGGTLRYASTAFDGPATVDIQGGVTLSLRHDGSGPYALAKQGAGSLTLSGAGGNVTLTLADGDTDISGLATGNDTLLNLSGGATVTALPKRIIGGATLNGVK
ncbi:MAG: hypothetical protein FWG50_13185, partial [Kiritimatiellaeota bacterium]|nr:hypothetical protein [Kiritimatiellota bacterium]